MCENNHDISQERMTWMQTCNRMFLRLHNVSLEMLDINLVNNHSGGTWTSLS